MIQLAQLKMNETENWHPNPTEILLLLYPRGKNSTWSYRQQNNVDVREAIIISCYSIVFLASILGNLMVFSTVLRNRTLRTSTYVFITNLAISDLLMTVLNIPFSVTRLLLTHWPFGSFMCSFVPLMQVTFVYVSTFTMTCIAVDRYRIITKPFRPRISNAVAIKTMVAVWILSLILSLPHAIFNEREVYSYRMLIRCRTNYPKAMSSWLMLITVSTQYVLPLSVTCILYCCIATRVWFRNTLGAVTEDQMLSHVRAKKKTITMLLLALIFFAVCWLPLNVFIVLREFQLIDYRLSSHNTIYLICHWLAMSSVCYNPFIYCCLNHKFRYGGMNCFLCMKDLRKKINFSLRVRGLSSKNTHSTENI